MPLSESTALCGPKVLARALGISIPDAQSICNWRSSKGADPNDVGKGLRKHGYAVKVREHNTVEGIEEFRTTHPNTVIILCYWDDLFGSADGHYVIYYGLDAYGDLRVYNPDANSSEMVLPRSKFEANWFDYKIDDHSVIYRRLAILAYKKDQD